MSLSREERFALWKAAGERCDWGNEPILFSEMEVDHLIPQSLRGDALLKVLDFYGLPSNYDLHAIENLAPACRRCNLDKSNRVLMTPAFALVLDRAARRAAQVRQLSTIRIDRRDVEKALAQLQIARVKCADDPEIVALIDSFRVELRESDSKTERTVDALTFTHHPSVAWLFDPEQRWTVLKILSPSEALITDGVVSGITGSHPSYQCPFCLSYGPWRGVLCTTCGQRSQPGD